MFEKLLSKRGLSFDRLRALLDLEAAGSLAKAADGDPTRQSQYSRQIKELEDFFGVRLTARKGHQLQLTPTGGELVEIVREAFSRLEDFQARCDKRPLSVTIASGASGLRWLVLPHLGRLQRAHHGLVIHLQDLRTADICSGLCEMRLDVGIIRQSALVPPLACLRLFRLKYSLFAAKELLPDRAKLEWRRVLEQVPLALQSSGGQFHRTLVEAARKEGVPLSPALCCLSFTQACQAVQTGDYAAVLPSIAARDLPADRYVELPLPLLKDYERELCLAWNPRLASLRPELEKLIRKFGQVLKG